MKINSTRQIMSYHRIRKGYQLHPKRKGLLVETLSVIPHMVYQNVDMIGGEGYLVGLRTRRSINDLRIDSGVLYT